MRLPILLKILLAIACIYLSFRLFRINAPIDNAINEHYNSLAKLRGDPALDTAENRKRYIQKKAEIMEQVQALRKNRYPNWYPYIGLVLGMISGFLVRNIIDILIKKRMT